MFFLWDFISLYVGWGYNGYGSMQARVKRLHRACGLFDQAISSPNLSYSYEYNDELLEVGKWTHVHKPYNMGYLFCYYRYCIITRGNIKWNKPVYYTFQAISQKVGVSYEAGFFVIYCPPSNNISCMKLEVCEVYFLCPGPYPGIFSIILPKVSFVLIM